MLLKTNPIQFNKTTHTFQIPSSKPETQRAIFIASLADGISYIYNDLRCSETSIMKAACRSIGATIIEHADHLEIQGVSAPQLPTQVIDCKGSGLVFRIFAALTSFIPHPVIITGDNILCGRVMKPLFDALRLLGGKIESICNRDAAPIVNRGQPLEGGSCYLPGNISSQFITAILLAAPFAKAPTKIMVEGAIYSLAYVKQTLFFMQASGIDVTFDEQLGLLTVYPGKYRPLNIKIKEDYTSASYLFAASALIKGEMRFRNAYGESMQGESAILNILEKMGIHHFLDHSKQEWVLHNPHDDLKGDYEFDAKDYPNIVPTLAVIGAYVIGTFKVKGAALTRFHKASRVEAITSELKKLGVNISIIYDGDIPDGFLIKGKKTYPGGVIFSSWQDHRIFMSLFVASLKTQNPCYFKEYEDIHCSFPDFLKEFQELGVKMETVTSPTQMIKEKISSIASS